MSDGTVGPNEGTVSQESLSCNVRLYQACSGREGATEMNDSLGLVSNECVVFWMDERMNE